MREPYCVTCGCKKISRTKERPVLCECEWNAKMILLSKEMMECDE